MKALLLLGLVALALCEPTRYIGDKVFRLWPVSDTHVSFIKDLASNMKVDFWSPDSADLITEFTEVDVHIPASHADMFSVMLQQSGMDNQVLIEDMHTAMRQQFDNHQQTKAHNYMKYNSWTDIEAWVSSITSGNPALISRSTIGKTYEGRNMHLLKIGKNTGSTKPAIFLDCGIHAREWISPAFCQWFIQEAVTTYGTDAQMTSLLNEMDVFVLPVFNVDGYEHTWKSDRMWRKTRSRKSGSNCIGADPNRNFDAGWCTLGASNNPCSDTYCGSSVESEIEVQNVANFIRKNKSIIKAYLTIHSYSQLLLFPYSYKYDQAKDHAELMSVAVSASEALRSLYGTRYTSGPGATTISLGASNNPCSDTYCGSSVESEIEVQNVANFIRKNKSIIKAYLTIHSYSQLLLFPYSYKYDQAKDHAELMSVAVSASEALRSLYGTRYTSGPGATTIYPAAGGSDDWAYDLGVKYSFTFELRDTGRYGFLLPESQIKPTCEETMLAVKYIAAYVQKNV